MNADPRPVVWCLMGPTGVGKTAWALELAQQVELEIISVDSALVYRGLDIGSAKPDPGERAVVPHHLIDIVDPVEVYSAARFRTDALAAIAAVLARGRQPLLVGGTGLYFRALMRGLSELPASDPAVRDRLNAVLQAEGSVALHATLTQVDPDAARRIHPNDPQRILRALEIHALTGRPMSQQQTGGSAASPYRWRRVILAPPDRSLHAAGLRQRFLGMLDAGLVEEVEGLRRQWTLDDRLPSMRSVGYRQVLDYLTRHHDRSLLVEAAVQATRQLAKRQLTWFRSEPAATWTTVTPEAAWTGSLHYRRRLFIL
jgi:tRNA dimethylallyltransferase